MPESTSPSANRAVFVSYAREDTAVAQRVAEALRSHGVEVWFDQNELRGGDAWDAKIRRQIKECTLFLPIISEKTQQRNEGYFRLEWELAEERTHLMVRGVPFIVPVVTDDLTEAVALVPDRFREVQWTRLPGALPTQQFVEQVKRLLASPRRPAAIGASPSPASTPPATSGTRQHNVPLWATAALGVVVLGLGTYFALRTTAKPIPAPVAAAKPAAETKTATLAPAGPKNGPKSIAVLPFTNMSEDKDASAFFADGMHEDILTNLALVHELYVTSRTTVMQFRDTKKTLRQVGEELGVAYVLEGSVRRVGEKVRITGQLIRADTDGHLWAEKFDRDLTDMFAIQAEIATAIAGKLKAVISPQEKKLIERRPTENLAAYDLYLKERALRDSARAGLDERITLLKAAVQLDPNFAAAWAMLGQLYSRSAALSDYTGSRISKEADSKAAIEKAVRLAPDSTETLIAQARYLYQIERANAQAIALLERAMSQSPSESTVHGMLSNIARDQGRFSDALNHIRKAISLDSGNMQHPRTAIGFLEAGRRYDEERTERRKRMDSPAASLTESYRIALISFQTNGSKREVEQFFSGLPNAEAKAKEVLRLKRDWAIRIGDLAEYVRLAQTAPRPLSTDLALVLAAQGDLPAARAQLSDIDALRSTLEQQPNNPRLWSALGEREAILGNKDEALRCGLKAVKLEPESRDAWRGPSHSVILAFVYAWTGDKDRAIAEYARLLRVPYSGLNVHEMKRHPAYAPLRSDPRFEALLNDPKNNAPLF